MFNCIDLENSGLILSVSGDCVEVRILKSIFNYQCYEISLKQDLLLEDNETRTINTGIKMKVPEGCVAIVHSAYPENGCEVEYERFFPSDGEIDLKIDIGNFYPDNGIIYKNSGFAHLYLKEDAPTRPV